MADNRFSFDVYTKGFTSSVFCNLFPRERIVFLINIIGQYGVSEVSAAIDNVVSMQKYTINSPSFIFLHTAFLSNFATRVSPRVDDEFHCNLRIAQLVRSNRQYPLRTIKIPQQFFALNLNLPYAVEVINQLEGRWQSTHEA